MTYKLIDYKSKLGLVQAGLIIPKDAGAYFRGLASIMLGKHLLDIVNGPDGDAAAEILAQFRPKVIVRIEDLLDIESSYKPVLLEWITRRHKERRLFHEEQVNGNTLAAQYHAACEYACNYYVNGLHFLMVYENEGGVPFKI